MSNHDTTTTTKTRDDEKTFISEIRAAAKGEDPGALLSGVARQMRKRYADVLTVSEAQTALAEARSWERVRDAYVVAAVGAGVADDVVAADVGISKARVSQIKGSANLRKMARSAGMPITAAEAAAVQRDGNVKAVKRAISDRDAAALDTITGRAPKAEPTGGEKIRAAVKVLDETLSDIDLDRGDLADLAYAIKALDRMRSGLVTRVQSLGSMEDDAASA